MRRFFMTVTVSINRKGEKIALLRNAETKYTRAAYEIWEAYGFKRVEVLDIENSNEAPWEGVEYNHLLERDGTLYKFVEWLGKYPFDGIVIEKIGTCFINKT
jgi:hypothetical protein